MARRRQGLGWRDQVLVSGTLTRTFQTLWRLGSYLCSVADYLTPSFCSPCRRQVLPSLLPAFTLAYGTLLKASLAPHLKKRDKKKEKTRAEELVKEKKKLEAILAAGVSEEGKRGKGRSREFSSRFDLGCWVGRGSVGREKAIKSEPLAGLEVPELAS